LDNRQAKSGPRKSILESKWSPLKPLPDDEYEKMLDEKILRLDAEIALVDEHIAALTTADRAPANAQTTSPNNTNRPTTQ
jgi:hypothetical protein